MIVTDLDCTLLRDDKTISGRTQDVLRHCRDAGIKIVYATGRGCSAARIVPAGLFDGRIVNNGACAMDGDGIVYDRPVPGPPARALQKACEERGLEAVVNANNGKLYVEGCGPEDAAFIRARLPEELHMYMSNDGVAMVMHRDAAKAKAVAELARHWGIAREEIAAFGDDLNDVDMLAYAGIGVAVGNALDEVKAAADDICGSNEEDGPAGWLLDRLASVAEPESEGVLVCEPREAYAGGVFSTVKSLGVRCKLVSAESELYAEMRNGDWTYIFASHTVYDNLKVLGPRLNPDIKPVLLAAPGERTGAGALSAITVPVNPISVANVLNGLHIHRKKPDKPSEKDLEIGGVDVRKGLAMVGGCAEKYSYLLTVFIQDAFEKIGKIRACLDAGDLSMYATHAHALKSAAGYIGADDLSEAARKLEMAGKRGDAALIEEHNPAFINELEELMSRISKAVR